MSFRAVRTLQQVDIIAAEDTRHTAKLLQHYLRSQPLRLATINTIGSYATNKLLHRLTQGENIALVTDAGMPGISDPGYELILACIESQISSDTNSWRNCLHYCLSSLWFKNCISLFLKGFLPTRLQERQSRLQQLATESRTLVLYESPHRLKQTLQGFDLKCSDKNVRSR